MIKKAQSVRNDEKCEKSAPAPGDKIADASRKYHFLHKHLALLNCKRRADPKPRWFLFAVFEFGACRNFAALNTIFAFYGFQPFLMLNQAFNVNPILTLGLLR